MTLRSSNTTRTWHWPLTLYSKIKPCHNTIVFKSTLWEKNEERGLKKNKSKVKYASDSITLAPKMLIDFGFPQTCENDLSFCLSLKKKEKKKKRLLLLSCKIPRTNLLYFYEISLTDGPFQIRPKEIFGFLVRVGLVRSNGYLASAFIPSKIIIINEILIRVRFKYSSLGQVHLVLSWIQIYWI